MIKKPLMFLIATIGLACPKTGRADVVTEWNLKTAQFMLDARLLAPEAKSGCRHHRCLRVGCAYGDCRKIFAASGQTQRLTGPIWQIARPAML